MTSRRREGWRWEDEGREKGGKGEKGEKGKGKERRRELFCSNFRASCAEKFEAKEKKGGEREKEKGERVFLPGGVFHERSATIKRLRPRWNRCNVYAEAA